MKTKSKFVKIRAVSSGKEKLSKSKEPVPITLAKRKQNVRDLDNTTETNNISTI